MLKIAFLNSHKFHLLSELHTFLISNTFISKTRLKLVKIQASAKSHPEAEILLFESYSRFSSTLSSKNATTYSEKISKRTSVPVFIRLIIMKMKIKMKHRSSSYDINRPRSRHGYKFSKHKKCLGVMMLICIKQHLSNI